MATRNSSHSHVTKSLWGRGNKEEPSGCLRVCARVCLMVLSTKPTKILPAIKKCTALAPQLIFPRFLQLQTSRAIVISSPSVSIWMPESQLRLRLIESAPGPSHAGTQMSSAWGGEEWRDGGRGAQGLNKRSYTSKSQTRCSREQWLAAVLMKSKSTIPTYSFSPVASLGSNSTSNLLTRSSQTASYRWKVFAKQIASDCIIVWCNGLKINDILLLSSCTLDPFWFRNYPKLSIKTQLLSFIATHSYSFVFKR